MAGEDPARLEFDGDEIAVMRRFDIETQRSSGDLADIVVHPVHHFVPDEAGLGRLRERLEREAADLPPEERARALLPAERLETGISFYGMEHYAADVHDVTPIFSWFGEEPIVLLAGAEEIDELAREYQEEIAGRFERSREEGHLYPAPDRVYVTGEELRERLAGARLLRLLDIWRDGAARFATARPPDYRRNLTGLARDVRRALAGVVDRQEIVDAWHGRAVPVGGPFPFSTATSAASPDSMEASMRRTQPLSLANIR